MSESAVSRLLLVRHGRTASNAEGRFQGQLDVELDALGRAQAAALAVWLGKQLADDAARGDVRIVCSDLRRTRQTAEPLASRLGLPVVPEAGLRERHAGVWEGSLRSEIEARYPEDFAAWVAGDDPVIEGGASLRQAGARFERALRRQLEVGGAQVLVAVGHGGAMRGGMLRLLGLQDGGASDTRVYRTFGAFGNCHWSELVRGGDGSWVLRAHNLSVPD